MSRMSTAQSVLVLLSVFSVLASQPAWGHQGHDHGDDDHGPGHDDIVEKDPNWTDASKVPFRKGSGFDLRWTKDGDKVLKMKMTAKTNGYVAVGFCPVWHGTMQGCDIVLGWVDNENGSMNVHDYSATGNSIPVLDEKQDYSEGVSGQQKDGFTSIIFKRKMNTGDESNDADLWHNNVHVIYAWHETDPTSPEEFLRHETSGRGHTSSPVSFKEDGGHDDHHHHHHNHGSGASSLMTTGGLSLSALLQAALLYIYFCFNH